MESGIDPGQEYYGQDYYSYEHGYYSFCIFYTTSQLYMPTRARIERNALGMAKQFLH